MNKIKNIIVALIATLFSFSVQAQNPVPTVTNDIMRSNGKIFVVMLVVLVIVIGLFVYLINLERKVTKLEKQIGK